MHGRAGKIVEMYESIKGFASAVPLIWTRNSRVCKVIQLKTHKLINKMSDIYVDQSRLNKRYYK